MPRIRLALLAVTLISSRDLHRADVSVARNTNTSDRPGQRRHQRGHRRAHGRTKTQRATGPAGGGRQPPRRKRQHRHQCSGEGSARRLDAGGGEHVGDQPGTYDQCRPYSAQSASQSASRGRRSDRQTCKGGGFSQNITQTDRLSVSRSGDTVSAWGKRWFEFPILLKVRFAGLHNPFFLQNL